MNANFVYKLFLCIIRICSQTLLQMGMYIKVSVNENFSTLLDFVFFLDFWHEWVLNFIVAEKENQKVFFNPSKMSLF